MGRNVNGRWISRDINDGGKAMFRELTKDGHGTKKDIQEMTQKTIVHLEILAAKTRDFSEKQGIEKRMYNAWYTYIRVLCACN